MAKKKRDNTTSKPEFRRVTIPVKEYGMLVEKITEYRTRLQMLKDIALHAEYGSVDTKLIASIIGFSLEEEER